MQSLDEQVQSAQVHEPSLGMRSHWGRRSSLEMTDKKYLNLSWKAREMLLWCSWERIRFFLPLPWILWKYMYRSARIPNSCVMTPYQNLLSHTYSGALQAQMSERQLLDFSGSVRRWISPYLGTFRNFREGELVHQWIYLQDSRRKLVEVPWKSFERYDAYLTYRNEPKLFSSASVFEGCILRWFCSNYILWKIALTRCESLWFSQRLACGTLHINDVMRKKRAKKVSWESTLFPKNDRFS